MTDLRDDIIKTIKKELKLTPALFDGTSDTSVTEWVSTGSVIINGAIHCPGIPVGCVTSIRGEPAAGKSTLAYHLIESTQAGGGLAILADTEHTYTPARAARIGVKNADVLFYQDLCLEDFFALVTRAANTNIEAGSPQQITIIEDSHSSTPTRAEVEMDEDASRSEIATSARVTSLHLKRLIGSGMLERGRIALVLISQMKTAPMEWGVAESFIASKPIGFHASVMLKLKRPKRLDKREGILMRLKVDKNKVGAPYAECEVDVLNETGIDESRQLLAAALEYKVVTLKGGGNYTYGQRTFRKRNWPKLLEEVPHLRRELLGLMLGVLK